MLYRPLFLLDFKTYLAKVEMKREEYFDYEHFLYQFEYSDIKCIRKVLKNLPRFQSLAERGISNAMVILADISKALECEVNGYKKITEKQWDALYLLNICGFTTDETAMILECSPGAVTARSRMALNKLLDILGENNGSSRKSISKRAREKSG